MGFGGHVLAMIQSYRSNRELLQRRDKMDPTVSPSKQVSKARKPFKNNLTTEQKNQIRIKQRELGKARNRKNLVLAVLILLGCAFIMYRLILFFYFRYH